MDPAEGVWEPQTLSGSRLHINTSLCSQETSGRVYSTQGIWKLSLRGLARDSSLSHLDSPPWASGALGCVYISDTEKRSVPVLKGKPGAVFDRAGDIRRDNYHVSGSHAVPGTGCQLSH